MTSKSGEDHYNEAGKLLDEAGSHHEPDTRAKWCLELARMHLDMSRSQVSRAVSTASDASPVRGGRAGRSRSGGRHS
jgi:hypothetical protein